MDAQQTTATFIMIMLVLSAILATMSIISIAIIISERIKKKKNAKSIATTHEN